LKESIELQSDIINMSLAHYKLGYVPENVECSVVYDKGMATYYDCKNGEKVDERPIDEKEQLQLSNRLIDAEDIIRESSAVE
jgi:hypothetical protein